MRRMSNDVTAVVLAAGRGERMKSERAKVLHEAAGMPLLGHVVETLKEADIRRIVVVIGHSADNVRRYLESVDPGIETVLQSKQLGTGHAVLQARSKLRGKDGRLLILPGDAPCVRPSSVRRLIEAKQCRSIEAAMLTAEIKNPKGYGRVIRNGSVVTAIREELDLSSTERSVCEINSGVYIFHRKALFEALGAIRKNEKKREYYLTDVVEQLARTSRRVAGIQAEDPNEVIGVNTRDQLSMAHQILSDRELKRHMASGVTILNPAQTFISRGVKIGTDTVIYPFTWIERGVTIGSKCTIGPFAKIRSGVRIGNDVQIGSFVELVRSKVGSQSNIKHLSYIGDATLGRQVNIGAGTITANYDGKHKHQTVIEDQVLIGCDTILVAPVRVGKQAKTGAGSVVPAKRNVPRGKTALGVPAKVIG